MADYIPFVNSIGDWDLVKEKFADSKIIRTTANNRGLIRTLSKGHDLWIDPATDALDNWPVESRSRLADYLNRLTGIDRLVDSNFQMKPKKEVLREFVESALQACISHNPQWVTLPLLPWKHETKRGRINKKISDLCADWRQSNPRFEGKFILPAIMTNWNQLKLSEGTRDNVVDCFKRSTADGLWVVNTDLREISNPTAELRERIDLLVRFHSDIRIRGSVRNGRFVVGGPYWGINVLLWSKGLSDYPAIGIGRRFEYNSPGGFAKRPKSRVVIPSLYRLVVADPELRQWLQSLKERTELESDVEIEFTSLSRGMVDHNYGPRWCRQQVAGFYSNWLKKLQSAQKDSRALVLYQLLSRAYVLGKQLPDDLPKGNKPRGPHKVAEHLMLNCL